jgi:hypothetical protein
MEKVGKLKNTKKSRKCLSKLKKNLLKVEKPLFFKISKQIFKF